jgi:hypothetical protein
MYEMEGASLDLPIQAWPVCLAAPAPAGRPPGPATRVRSRFPGSFGVPPGFPWGGVRFRRGCISTPAVPRGASVRGKEPRLFPLSTGRRRLSTRERGYPPPRTQHIHRSPPRLPGRLLRRARTAGTVDLGVAQRRLFRGASPSACGARVSPGRVSSGVSAVGGGGRRRTRIEPSLGERPTQPARRSVVTAV